MIKIVQIGLGPLGQKIVRMALERGTIRIVGAVDNSPDKAGRDLGTLCGLKRLGIIVQPNFAAVAGGKKAHAAVLTTVSSLERLAPQVRELAEAGLHIVSTCEELAFPWIRQPQLARRLDAICKKYRVACVGTGVNPGYLMDFLPCILTAICQRVERIHVQRFQDASLRRKSFQSKVGAGLSLKEFQAASRSGTVRHIGLTESMQMIAHQAGWQPSRITESLRPIITERAIRLPGRLIRRGQVCGVEQIGRAFAQGREVVRLHFRAAVGARESFDRVEIIGEPSLTAMIPGGINGDIATCAITLNALGSIVKAAPGLRTMLDLPAVMHRAIF